MICHQWFSTNMFHSTLIIQSWVLHLLQILQVLLKQALIVWSKVNLMSLNLSFYIHLKNLPKVAYMNYIDIWVGKRLKMLHKLTASFFFYHKLYFHLGIDLITRKYALLSKDDYMMIFIACTGHSLNWYGLYKNLSIAWYLSNECDIDIIEQILILDTTGCAGCDRILVVLYLYMLTK